MKPTLLIVGEPPEPAAAELLAENWNTRCGVTVDDKALRNCDALWCGFGARIPHGPIYGPYRCEVVACPMTGTEHIDRAALSAAGTTVLSLASNGRFMNSIHATAEHALCLMLAALRKLPQALAQRPPYQRDALRGGELHGRTVGIVGVGRIGRMVAGYCLAFGCRVLGWDRREVPEPIEPVAELDDLLAQSDILSLHLSLTDSTRGLLDLDRLRKMKRGALLVNTARGALIDERALLTVLRQGPLAMAALDVLTGDPEITTDHPLVRYASEEENLLLTPHIGGNTVESRRATDCWMAHRLLDWWTGKCASSV